MDPPLFPCAYYLPLLAHLLLSASWLLSVPHDCSLRPDPNPNQAMIKLDTDQLRITQWTGFLMRTETVQLSIAER